MRSKILVIWSNYYGTLARKQLNSCIELLSKTPYDYKIETVKAGTYEIPAVLQYYHTHAPFNGYIPLGLLLKGNTDHYEFILEHLKECFVKFAMKGILIGNGIISAPTMNLLQERVENTSRVNEAVNAIHYLIQLTTRIESN